MLIVNIAISVLLVLGWAYLTFQLIRSGVTRFRGVVKAYANHQFYDQRKHLETWFYVTLVFSILPCIWVGWLSWATDYSFLVGLFPIVWYYFLTRFLLFEKSDLM